MAHHHQISSAYRFHPTNIEVIKYLIGFARNDPLPDQNKLMQQLGLYGDREPWNIFEGSNTNTRYFITQLKKDKPDSKRVNRTVGKGTWNPQGIGKEVFDNKSRLMGYVKSLKYTPRAADKSSIKATYGEWLMTEYSLHYGYVKDIKKKGYVICKIKKKKEKAGHDDKKKGIVNDENMSDNVEEYIDSVLEEEDTNHDVGEEENENIEYIEGEEVGTHFLAMLGCHDDDDGDHNGNQVAGEHALAGWDAIDLDAINFVC